jgi:hypothetical protein
MTPDQNRLWEKLRQFEITPAGLALTFEARLAGEQGWDRAHTLAVVDEYRRFLFLLLAAPHPVTPSEAVDSAWHLHLLYTRSYWDEFCGKIAGRPVHHGPTAGGEAEQVRYEEQYQQTLETYSDLFGHPAPSEIWPDVRTRFGQAADWRWLNAKDWFMWKKPRFLRRR